MRFTKLTLGDANYVDRFTARVWLWERPFSQEPALVVRDVVRNVFGRLGMVGAILLVSALIFGALAGGVVIHRLDSTRTASSQDEQGDQAGDSNQGKKKSKHANHGHQDKQEQADSEDKDA